MAEHRKFSTLNLDQETYAWLTTTAKDERRTRVEVVRTALEMYARYHGTRYEGVAA